MLLTVTPKVNSCIIKIKQGTKMKDIVLEKSMITFAKDSFTPDKLEEFKKDQLFKELGFSDIELSDIDVKIVEYILIDSRTKNEEFSNISIKKLDIINDGNINISDLEDFIARLENNGIKYFPRYNNSSSIKIDYSIFWRTNFLQISNGGLHFISLLQTFFEILLSEEINLDKYIIVDSVFKEVYSCEQLNAILSYCENFNIIEYTGKDFNYIYVCREFKVDKSLLFHLNRELRNKFFPI